MTLPRTTLLIVMAVLAAGACSRKQPPEVPAPPPPTQTQAPPPARTDDEEARRRAAEEARRAAERAGMLATLQEMVYFDYDDARVRSDAESVLSRKVPILRTNAGVTLRITGHADERGSLEYNEVLGLRRANSVRDYLVGFGIDASRITTATRGEDQPVDPGHDESAWSKNRRADFNVTAGAENLIRSQ